MRTGVKFSLGGLIVCGLTLAITAVSHAQTTAAPAKNQALIDARKKVTDAQTVVNTAKEEQKRIKDKKRAEFETKEEWKNTVSNEKKAKSAYEASRKAALASLQAKPAYKQLVTDRDALQKKQEDLSKNKDADPDDVRKTGTDLATKGIALKNMEKEAMDRDEKSLEAKENLDNAEKNMKALDDEVDGALANDPDYLAVQQQVEMAEQQLAQAKDALNQQQKADSAAHAAQSKAASASKTPSKSTPSKSTYHGPK